MKKLFLTLATVLFVISLFSTTSWATNGMNMIGYDTISSGMGGADEAVPSGSTATAENPANIVVEDGQSMSFNLSLLMPNLSMSNATPAGSNDVDGEAQIFPLPEISYASKIGDSKFTWGLGIFAQGGMGVDFQELNTGFGNQDDLFSNVAYLKVSPTLAYQPIDSLSIGASVHVGYAAISYEFYKNTSFFDPGADQTPMTQDDILFPGQKLENATSYGYAGRIGLNYSPIENLYFGASYSMKADLELEEGELTMNFNSLGMGRVKYDATIDGFTWPAQYDAGVAYYAFDERLLLAFDVTFIQWSDAIKEVTVNGKNPDNAMLPENMQTMELNFPFFWEDQTVFAFGTSFDVSDAFTLRAGVNISESPVKDEYLSPLFPAIIENHVTLGFGYNNGGFRFDVAFEKALEASQTNNNTNQMENPFGPGVEVKHDQNTIHMMLSYAW